MNEQTADIRVSELVGDRLCARCTFNLSGQVIVREGRYGLLIVRCPECGTAAGIQEYPMLGRWVNRLAFVAAGAWLVLLLGFLAANVGAVCGMTVGISESLVSKYANVIAQEYQRYSEVNSRSSPLRAVRSPFPSGVPHSALPEWWEKQDHRALLAESGGWAGAIDWPALKQLVFPVLVGLAFGIIWAVALPFARGWKRLVPCGLVLVIAMFSIAVNDLSDDSNSWSWGYHGATIAAYGQIGWTLHGFTLLTWAGACIAGLWTGRAVARAIVVAFLPPRLRGSWSFLWICDKLPLPRPAPR